MSDQSSSGKHQVSDTDSGESTKSPTLSPTISLRNSSSDSEVYAEGNFLESSMVSRAPAIGTIRETAHESSNSSLQTTGTNTSLGKQNSSGSIDLKDLPSDQTPEMISNQHQQKNGTSANGRKSNRRASISSLPSTIYSSAGSLLSVYTATSRRTSIDTNGLAQAEINARKSPSSHSKLCNIM